MRHNSQQLLGLFIDVHLYIRLTQINLTELLSPSQAREEVIDVGKWVLLCTQHWVDSDFKTSF